MYYVVKPDSPGMPDRIYSPMVIGGAWFAGDFIALGLSRPLLEKSANEEMKKIYVKHNLSIAGKPLPTPDCLPIKLCLNPESRRKPSGITQEYLGHFFESASGGLFVSSAFAEVLRQHDLGVNTHLTPIPIFDAKGDTLIETGTDYYHLWIGESKDTLLDMASAGAICKPAGPSPTWTIISSLDNVLALEEKALSGPDLWIEQQACISTFFMSDRLHTALKKAKLLGRLHCVRVRVLKLPSAD